MGKSQTSDANKTAKSAQGENQAMAQQAFKQSTNAYNHAITGDNAIYNKNPFTDPNYIKNLNLLQGDALDSAKNDTNEALTNYGTRTGTNAAYIGDAAKENARQLAREALSTRAGQFAKDYGTWQQMRMQALGDLGNLSSTQANLATGQGSNANRSLDTQAQLSMQPGFWSQFGQSMLNAGAKVGAAALSG